MNPAQILLTLFCVVLIVGAPVACTMHKDQLMADAISNGHDPIAVKCAMDTNGTTNNVDPICLAKAMGKQ